MVKVENYFFVVILLVVVVIVIGEGRDFDVNVMMLKSSVFFEFVLYNLV